MLKKKERNIKQGLIQKLKPEVQLETLSSWLRTLLLLHRGGQGALGLPSKIFTSRQEDLDGTGSSVHESFTLKSPLGRAGAVAWKSGIGRFFLGANFLAGDFFKARKFKGLALNLLRDFLLLFFLMETLRFFLWKRWWQQRTPRQTWNI